MRIAICDDDEGCCAQLTWWLEEFRQTEELEMLVAVYTQAEELIRQMKAGEWYDVVFLDIELPKQSGIELGHGIRENLHNENTSIVFISGKTRYCQELFELEPLNFHHKPLKRQDIIGDVKKVARRIRERRNVYRYTQEGVPRGVPVAEIMYIQAVDKEVEITTQGGDKILVRDSLRNLGEVLGNPFICRCHRAYMVNCMYVQKSLDRWLFMKNGEEIPVGKKYQKEVKETMLLAAKEVW